MECEVVVSDAVALGAVRALGAARKKRTAFDGRVFESEDVTTWVANEQLERGREEQATVMAFGHGARRRVQ